MEPNGDPDVLRVWSLLSEVSEQLSQNRSSAVNLHALSDGAKAQAIHSQTGFVLRRFNLDKPKEVYDAELERMNAAMSAENMTLLNDNRQLSALIREYEQTLENIMATFRTRAHEVQQRELALMRQYESVIVQRETEALDESLTASNTRSESLARVGRMLRTVLRRLGGEDVRAYEAHLAHAAHAEALAAGRSDQSREASSTSEPPETQPSAGEEKTGGEAEGIEPDKGKDKERVDETQEGEADTSESDAAILEEEDNPEKHLAAAEWALERESELCRLEKENEHLRKLVNGLLNAKSSPSTSEQAAAPAPTHRSTDSSSSAIPENPNGEGEGRGSEEHPSFSTLPRQQQQQQQRLLGGRPGTVGPFGTYKKSTGIRVDNR
ncbi:hypothetical protein L226DRAFT_487972 [Lentinus tigrinus ALCF2SS1-7]|uniref:Uncharacterized protein n=1 Tax=Lentinus tigrinus ALCF2SS1-6 TaxID=1328759 RepID=A0A5C2RSG7_9APHY|nr:hypothetical protein L227DRAFT_657423 [Lentinus tigrinus ALCF2SS1-6]RPD73864.1 hypothetical protein L226DRAFT_487972 [Lentinus tigrinus ALCF2SS1-7]